MERGALKGRGRARAKPLVTQGKEQPPQQRGPNVQATTTIPQAYQRPPQAHAPLSGGRASHRTGSAGQGPSGESGNVTGISSRMTGLKIDDKSGGNGNAGGNGAQVGRGSMRGRRPIDVIRTRPKNVENKKGESGKTISLSANYYRLETRTDWSLLLYRVDYAPEEDQTHVRKQLLSVHRNTLGGPYVFDGTVLYTANKLTAAKEDLELFSRRETDGVDIRLTLKLVGDLMVGDHHYIQFYNMLTRKCLQNLRLQLVGRDYYDARNKIEHHDLSLEIWPGYVTSIRQHDPHILMCAEITHKIMRQDTVFKIYTDICRENAQDFKNLFRNAVLGCTILTDYNNRTYKIDDVDFNVTPANTFKRNNQDISYAAYMYEKYNIRVQSRDQPMLVSKSKPREIRAGMTELVYLIPELCRMTGLSEQMRGNFTLMRSIADRTRIGPRDRVTRLLSLNRRFLSEPRIVAELQDWGMRLENKLVEFHGRVLPMENILFGKNQSVPTTDKVDWTNHFRSSEMFKMGRLEKWVIVYPQKAERDIETFVNQLIKVGQGMRFSITQPEYVSLQYDRGSNYLTELEEIISTRSPLFIICVVSNNNSDRYSTIKKKCCVDRATPTQVVLLKNAGGRNMSVTTKIAIQINAKIGGAPWSLSIPLKGLMVVGFDVCHDNKIKTKSYGAMVASLDNAFSRYYSCVSAHTGGEELSNDLALNIVKAVKRYQSHSSDGAFPSRILIYRDGVGEGQIHYVYEHELEIIKRTLAELYGEVPKLGMIIVTKRINTRIFASQDNPPPGTVVDDVITLPERYDFYLVSQSVRQGTVSPTSYNVIYDTLGLDPDKLQRLTYKMTHLYYNWSGTVRVPAPCQYAHKLAYLVGQHLHRSPNTGLEDLLYFL